ncbi:hypothetical protein ABW21_db0209906 [Orbilia brochopaga]|nr:hypothetical protein ABW21_db0209906 [Drechslerella brochopaga]
MDVLGDLSFGRHFKMLETEGRNHMNDDLFTCAILLVFHGFLPFMGLIKTIGVHIPHAGLVKILKSGDKLRAHADEALRNIQHQIKNLKDGQTQPSIFSKILENASKPGLKYGLTPAQARDEAMGFILAATDTTTITLTYTVWAVMRHVEVRRKLEAELATLDCKRADSEASWSDSRLFTDQDLRQFPYLDCIISEGLRLFGAVIPGLPRIVPGGNGGRQLGPYFLPTGTEVSVPPFTIHRDPDIFPDPDL